MKSSGNLYVKRRAKANARERCRMLNLNKSLERLKKHIPLYLSDYAEFKQNELKLPKIETLKLAVNYIKALKYSLDQNRKLELEEFFYILSFNLRQTTVSILRSKLYLESKVEEKLLVDGILAVNLMQPKEEEMKVDQDLSTIDQSSNDSSVFCGYR